MEIHKNFIGGEWVDGSSVNQNINPSNTNEIVGRYARADAAQTERAILSAQAAQSIWSAVTITERSEILDRIGSEVLSRKEELANLLAAEEGKTLREALGEVTRAGMLWKFFAGEAVRCTGDVVESVRQGVVVEVTREPVGVVGVISPWNFPIAIPTWKAAPALAFGNTVVLKPADLVPGSAWVLAEIISRSGLPKGAFNLVMGSGSQVGDAIVGNERVDAVTFTGSDVTGRRILERVASRGAKVQLEMGGKNPLVVLDDADVDLAVDVAVDGAFFSTGQRCTASSRLIVTDNIYDEFVTKAIERIKSLKVGHALDKNTMIGPVSSQSQLESNLNYLNIGRQEGAVLACGGDLLDLETPGFYMSPALFIDTDNSMRINQEEIFGPVASVIRVKNYDEALATANDTIYGLTSGICTSSLKYAADFKKNSKAGMVMINLPTAGVDYHVPFGGRKGSSYGQREQGTYAREFFTTIKTVYVSTGR